MDLDRRFPLAGTRSMPMLPRWTRLGTAAPARSI
jgi:hypothetical protein